MSEPVQRSLPSALVGRMFVHPIFDYALIGGVLSLLVAAVVVGHSEAQGVGYMDVSDASKTFAVTLPFFILFSNHAHFAASTVRLYTKPGTFQALPFLTMCFPLVCLAVLTLFVYSPIALGPNLVKLYLTWSPFHYAAQAFGLAVMYSYRSGCQLKPTDKRLLWWVCMIPFLFNFLTGPDVGLNWLTHLYLPAGTYRLLNYLVGALALVTAILLFAKVWRSNGSPMPLISLMMIISNGVWWFVLAPLQAFVYATIFHGVQYLAIVIMFHVKDQIARPENRRPTLYHVAWFYGASLLLGYGLFYCMPRGYALAGFDLTESLLLSIAAINIHHFVVDAYIWRLGKSDSNRQVVDSLQPALG